MLGVVAENGGSGRLHNEAWSGDPSWQNMKMERFLLRTLSTRVM